MQTCRRRGDRALDPGEDRLIIAPVARVAAARALDVGRQRHRAMTGERRAERVAVEVEVQGHVALGMLLRDGRGEILGESEAIADMQPASAFGEGAPRPAALISVKGDIDRCRAAPRDEPRRDHLGVVANEQVARAQQRREICDPPVCETSLCWDVQQARGLARLARAIGDQLARQREVEIVETHRVHCRR